MQNSVFLILYSFCNLYRGLLNARFSMRLLKANADNSFNLTWFTGDQIPPYAILSHRWEPDSQEVTYQDLTSGIAGVTHKLGYEKIRFCGKQAKHDDLDYFWVDSCCT
jgi:hypothetical protein